MSIIKTELRYDFNVTAKPNIDSGTWVGHGLIHYVDEELTFSFDVHRWGHLGQFIFEPGGDPAVNKRIEDDLLRILRECYDFAHEQAKQRFAADLYDGGSGVVSA